MLDPSKIAVEDEENGYIIHDTLHQIPGTGIYVTSLQGLTKNFDEINQLGRFKQIINVSNRRQVKSQFNASIEQVWLPFNDEDQAASQMITIADYLLSYLKPPVIIHCAAGISRSISVIIYFLLKSKKVSSVEGALKLIQTVRPIANPNPAFMKKLNEVLLTPPSSLSTPSPKTVSQNHVRKSTRPCSRRLFQ